MSSTKRKGVRTIAAILLTTGLINSVIALIAVGLVNVFLGDGVQGDITATAEGSISGLISSFTLWWLAVSGGFLIVSGVLYIILGLTRQKTPPAQSPHLS